MKTILMILGASLNVWTGLAAAEAQPATPPLQEAAAKLQIQYETTLESLKAEVSKSLPEVSAEHQRQVSDARAEVDKAQNKVTAAKEKQDRINQAEALVDHAKHKWIGGAEKAISTAETAIKKARTPEALDAAVKDLAKWQADKVKGLEALKERQANLEALMTQNLAQRKKGISALWAANRAKVKEKKAVDGLLSELNPFLSSDKLDATLAKCMVLTDATPRGLAEFARQDTDGETLVNLLLADDALMKEMLIAGGAKFGKYGQAMKIYNAIQKASPRAANGELHRLAIATSLEHAVPIALADSTRRSGAEGKVDPVKRYLHYERAFLAGELDPAFKDFTTWEYRHVVNSDAPDEILAWGRQMLRTYRPDHVSLQDYAWRYVSAVRTEVAYGSQNVEYDLPSINLYQNILKNGGVCGRRAFFGRFILRAFGIPTWGVTQSAHAALSHWTPRGWVTTLGAGFEHSWWDNDEVPLSGTQFLQETQARFHAADYLKVLRAQWVSRILGETPYNERKKIDGGFWSGLGRYLAVDLASKPATPESIAEQADAKVSDQKSQTEPVTTEELQATVENGIITIPAVVHGKSTGKSAAMKSHSGGMQAYAFGGFSTDYAFDAPRAGKYELTIRVATVQDGQVFITSVNGGKSPVETPVPYTVGLWQETQPLEVKLTKGKNVLNFELKPGSRGVAIKDFILRPVK